MPNESASVQIATSPVAPTTVKPQVTTFTLRFQLLVGVNVTLACLMTLALIADYRRELDHHLRHEKTALAAEAETIAASLPALETVDADSIRRLLESIVAGIDTTDSPRQRLLVKWNGQTIEPSRPGTNPNSNRPQTDGTTSALNADEPKLDWNINEYVVGTCDRHGFTVIVAEPLGDLRGEIRFETLERLAVLVLAGALAMGIVDFILLRALVRPMEQLSRTVEAIGGGKLGMQVAQYRTSELAVLAEAINKMSTRLKAHDHEVHQQMSKARRLQQHLLPPWPAIAGMTAERRFLPATEVTGDYHEAFPLPDNEWLFCIADVTGHGIPAAMTAAMLKVLFHQAVEQTHNPQQILTQLNSNFGAVVMPGDFATMLIVHWQPAKQQIHYANAGHEPGLLLRKSGDLVLLQSDGLMVGAVPEAKWQLHSQPVAAGDRLLMYTDGAVEIFNPKRELFGRKRLDAAYIASHTLPPKDAVTQIIDCLNDFRQDRPFSDDVTLLLLEFSTDTPPTS